MLRKTKGYSQEEIVEMLDVSRQVCHKSKFIFDLWHCFFNKKVFIG